MSYNRIKFLGLSVRGVNSVLGWNEQKGSMTAQLVQDAKDGDLVTVTDADIGKPAYFQLGAFKFGGLLQKFELTNDTNGLPTYEAIVEDPRDLLAGAKVILSGYSGGIGSSIRNLINVFGYWENTGFGNSQSNTSGMPWSLVSNGLNAIVNQPSYTVYGGPLTFRGVKYSIDLSELPAAPQYYRIPGGSTSILEIISQLCDDAGHDYFIELVGTTIKVRTVSRKTQPPLGTILSIANTNYGGKVVRSSAGMELRNETTSSFLVGGNISTLHLTTGISSFWDFDIDGNPILGVPGRYDFIDTRYNAKCDGPVTVNDTQIFFKDIQGTWPNPPYHVRIDNELIRVNSRINVTQNGASYNVTRGAFGTLKTAHANNASVQFCWGTTSTEYMNLNSAEIAEITGSTSYACTLLELRFALTDFTSWAAFVYRHKPDLAGSINLASPLSNNSTFGTILPPDLVTDAQQTANALGQGFVATEQYSRQHRVYDFVRKYAQEYMGKKYAVSVPFVVRSQDSETLRVTSSYMVSEGGYLPEGASPLGLSVWNEDVFKNPDGTMQGFARYDNLANTNPGAVTEKSALEPPGVISVNSTLFISSQADPNLIYAPSPMAVVYVGDGLFEKTASPLGDLAMLANCLMTDEARLRQAYENRAFGCNLARMFPAHRNPTAVAVPLRSTVLTYGPWIAAGAPGRVQFEQDPSLVPWEYGGYEYMDYVANAKVSQAVTNMQVSESGKLELAEPPQFSLGDTMQSFGPNITNIGVNFGAGGVSTTYFFQTYTQRFGVFSKGNAERMKKFGQTTQELRKALRASLVSAQSNIGTRQKAANARRALMQGAPNAINPATPHDVLVARSVYDSETGEVRTGTSTATYQEAVVFAGAADVRGDHKKMSVMSMTGLARPFTTKRDPGSLMPTYIENASSGGLDLRALNPWKSNNDVEVASWGASYEGLHARRRRPNPTTETFRPISLRAPVVAAGWGYDWEGKPIPGTGEVKDENGNQVSPETISLDGDGFPVGYLNRPDWWAAGPLDMVFDRRRGVWTSHDVVKGTADGAIGTNGGKLVVRGASYNYELNVQNWLGTSYASGDKLFALFNVHDRSWHVIGAGGTTQGGGDSYELPSGSRYTAFWRNASNEPVWSHSPIIQSLQLGGSGLTADSGSGTQSLDGFLALGRSSNSNLTKLRSHPNLLSELNLIFPSSIPTQGQFLGRGSGSSGSDVFLDWLTPPTATSSGTNTTTTIIVTSGNAYDFHSPEFIVTSGNPTSVQANWGLTSNPIGFANQAGTGELFARWDHVHQHPVFASGDLHPEYSLPSGDRYTLFHRNSANQKVWDGQPKIGGIWLGSQTVGSDGFVAIAHSGSNEYVSLRIAGPVPTGYALLLPAQPPTGIGQFLGVKTFDSTSTELQWQYAPTGSGDTFITGDTLPSGDPYTVLWKGPSGNSWSKNPIFGGAVLGGPQVGQNGFVAFGNVGSNDIISLKLANTPTTSFDLLLPNALPASVGQVLSVKTLLTASATLEWANAGSGNITSTIASGDPYSLYWTSGSGSQEWSRNPIIDGLTCGRGSGSDSLGYLGLRSSGADPKLLLQTQPLAGSVDLALLFPGALPSSSGQVLTAVSFDGGSVVLGWRNGVSVSGVVGLTKTFQYVSDVVCSGTTLIVTKRTQVHENGILVDEY